MNTIESFNSPGMFHEGVYYVGNKPLYIVEYYNEEGLETYASVYDVAEESKKEDAPEVAIKNPRKAYEIRKEVRGFGRDTVLSRLAAEKHTPKKYERVVNRPPLFTAPIVFGRDTFYDIEGWASMKELETNILIKGGSIVAEGGKHTGVFITLESVDWKRQYVPTEDVLNQYRARVSIWNEFL